MRLKRAGCVIIPYEEPGVGTLGIKVEYKKGAQQAHVMRMIIHTVFKATGVKLTPRWLKDHGLLPMNHRGKPSKA